jgi:hypothetical protein
MFGARYAPGHTVLNIELSSINISIVVFKIFYRVSKAPLFDIPFLVFFQSKPTHLCSVSTKTSHASMPVGDNT